MRIKTLNDMSRGGGGGGGVVFRGERIESEVFKRSYRSIIALECKLQEETVKCLVKP